MSQRYFALDSAGRPRFIYYHYNEEVDPDCVGAYYAACNSACDNTANWTHTRITQTREWFGELEWEILEKPALAITGGGPVQSLHLRRRFIFCTQ
jgi:hypothetical protein